MDSFGAQCGQKRIIFLAIKSRSAKSVFPRQQLKGKNMNATISKLREGRADDAVVFVREEKINLGERPGGALFLGFFSFVEMLGFAGKMLFFLF